MSAPASTAPATSPTTAPVAAGFHALRVAEVRTLTADAVAISFAVPKELREAYTFRPGQHLTLRTTLGGVEVRRSYSICSTPSSGRLTVAVKRLTGGAFSAHANDGLRVGAEVDAMVPAGRFGVDPDPLRARHYAAVAAGSGITPIMSILASVLEVEPDSRCTLVYANRDVASVMFLDELADLKDRHPARLQVLHVLSREQQEAELLQGRVDGARLQSLMRGLIPPDTVDEWFLCGPFTMVTELAATLAAAGVSPSHVHRELFHIDGEVPRITRRRDASSGTSRTEVTVRLDGRTSTFAMPDEGSILDALLAVRADAPYACKGGVCGTCRSRLVSGEVDMARTYALEQDEIDAGFVLACQSSPVTPQVELDFDA